jgi:hypothetical protein
MLLGAVIGIDHMTGAAAAGAVVARLIVGARKREQRIQQAGLLQSEECGIGTQLRSKAARAQFDIGTARLFVEKRNSGLGFRSAAAFKHAQNVSRLRHLPALQRLKIRQHAFLFGLVRRGRRIGLQSLRSSVAAVALAEVRVL